MQDADEWGRPGRGEVMTTFCMHGRQDRRRGAWRALAAALKSLSCDADSLGRSEEITLFGLLCRIFLTNTNFVVFLTE